MNLDSSKWAELVIVGIELVNTQPRKRDTISHSDFGVSDSDIAQGVTGQCYGVPLHPLDEHKQHHRQPHSEMAIDQGYEWRVRPDLNNLWLKSDMSHRITDLVEIQAVGRHGATGSENLVSDPCDFYRSGNRRPEKLSRLMKRRPERHCGTSCQNAILLLKGKATKGQIIAEEVSLVLTSHGVIAPAAIAFVGF